MPVWRTISCALAIPFLLTADDPPVPVMHAQARVVQVDVVVTGDKGKAITELLQKDFTLLDDGRVRTIDIFSLSDGGTVPSPPATPHVLPHNVFSNRNSPPAIAPNRATIIVLDASPAKPAAQKGAVEAARAQATGRVMRMKPDEQIAVFVISKGAGLLLLQNYTSDRELLLRRLREFVPRNIQPDRLSPWIHDAPLPSDYTESGLPLLMPADPAPSIGEPPPRRAMLVPAREQEYQIDNSVRENRMSLQTLAERLALLPGRKNIFWATTGFPPRLAHEPGWEHTLTALNEANVSVSSGGCSNSQREIAAATGGSPTCLDTPGAAVLNEAARTTYTLGFYLQESERDDAFHSLKVKVNRPHVELFYRQGYVAGKTQDALHERRPELETVLLSQVDATDVGITAHVETKPGNPRGTLDIQLNLDPATLSLSEQAGSWKGNVEEMFVQMNASGNTLAKISDNKKFEMTAAQRARYDSQGVSWPMSIPRADGATKLTIVVRDSKTGRLGSLTIPLP